MKTAPSSFPKNEQLFFLFGHEFLYKLHALSNTMDHRNHPTQCTLHVNVLCEQGRIMWVLFVWDFIGKFFFRIVGH